MFDMTGLPDTSKIKEVGRIRARDTPGGWHKSSPTSIPPAGPCCLLRRSRQTDPHGANIYDMEKFRGGRF